MGSNWHSVVGGDGPAVLLLHGWPQTWWEWRHVMPALAEQQKVIAVCAVLAIPNVQRQSAAMTRRRCAPI